MQFHCELLSLFFRELKKTFLFIILSYLCLTFNCAFALQIDESDVKNEHTGHFVFDTVPINLEEITESGDRIFAGVCTNVEEIKKDPQAKLPVVKYTFKIIEKIKGFEGQKEVSFKQWLPTTTDAGYEIGKKYVLFLYPNSTIGLTSPVGFLQGHFSVSIDPATEEEVVVNKLGNRGLSRNLKTQRKIQIDPDKELNNYISQSSENGDFIRYKEFVKTVKYLVKE